MKFKSLILSFLFIGFAHSQQAPAPIPDPVTLRVNMFRGANNSPIFIWRLKKDTLHVKASHLL
ncbi:MAG: hypothetical protein EXR35_06355 [Limnohabitans sp.]|nr:hypothetical protein [Limnohabitans sp.]